MLRIAQEWQKRMKQSWMLERYLVSGEMQFYILCTIPQTPVQQKKLISERLSISHFLSEDWKSQIFPVSSSYIVSAPCQSSHPFLEVAILSASVSVSVISKFSVCDNKRMPCSPETTGTAVGVFFSFIFFMSWKGVLECVGLYKYLKKEIVFLHRFPCSCQNLNPQWSSCLLYTSLFC